MPIVSGECGVCGAPESISYCVDCDTNLCSDCRMCDTSRDEDVCEMCLIDREKAEED